MIKKLLIYISIFIGLLTILLIFNTLRYSSKQEPTEAQPIPPASENNISHFQEAIKFKTVSFEDSTKYDSVPFFNFHKFLETTYPLIHQKLKREVISKLSLLYEWEGKNPNLAPIILLAHQDVVPVEEASIDQWSVDPFGGQVKDDFIWGRGTVDDKINLISIFEVTEKLLQEGYQPQRSIYLVFGHDEEQGGNSGAKNIASLLQSRNVHADLVMDEGGFITTDKVPFLEKPVALLGTSEKGYMSLTLTANKTGGHSSMPEPETAISILTRALDRIHENPFEAEFIGSSQSFLDFVGPEMPFFQKMLFANQWLFNRILLNIYEKSASSNATVRTTSVPTILKAGMKDNVIPTMAEATVNFRLLPGNSSSDVIERVKKLIDDDRIKISIAHNFAVEATPKASSVDGFGFTKVSQTINKSIGNTFVAPFLMIGGTDSRYFSILSDNIIKFSPMIDPIGFHTIDERVSIKSFGMNLWFYEQLIRNLD